MFVRRSRKCARLYSVLADRYIRQAVDAAAVEEISDADSSSWIPTTWMEKLISKWHDSLPPDLEVAYLESMRNIQDKSPIERWGLFAGCSVASKFYSGYSSVLRHTANIHITFHNSLLAEKVPAKQAFLKCQHAPLSVLVGDTKELLGEKAVNLTSTGTNAELLPFCLSLDGGIPCVSRTPLSCNRTKNLGCVGDGRGATGVGFADVMNIVKTHNPEQVTLECVKQLGQVQDDGQSDTTYMLSEFRAAGYWAHTAELDALQYGSPANRIRQYWIALMGLEGSDNEIAHFFTRLLNGFKLRDPFPPSYYITTDDDTRKEESARLGLRTYSEFGPRVVKSGRGDFSYKLEHKLIFEANCMAWPLNFESLHKGFNFAGMFSREMELAVLVDTLWPSRQAADQCEQLEFFNVNTDATRLLKSYLDQDRVRREDSLQGPWGARPWTLVGSGKMVVRISRGGGLDPIIRCMDAIEYMRMIGWSDDAWTPLVQSLSTLDGMDMVANLAGNAYSVFHFGPWAMSTMATVGRFHKDYVKRDCANNEVGLHEECGGESLSDEASGSESSYD
jgi:hypothetical protein